MPAAEPTRSSRRTATTRRRVIDSSDIEGDENALQQDDDSEEFTPAPKRSVRASRRSTAAPQATPSTATRGARSRRVRESIEPLEIESFRISSPGGESVATESTPPARKRQSVRAARRSRVSIAPGAPTPSRPQSSRDSRRPSEAPSLPALQPSESPERSVRHSRSRSRNGTPLAEIMEASLNEQTPKPIHEEHNEIKAEPESDDGNPGISEDTAMPDAPVDADTAMPDAEPAVKPEVTKVNARETEMEKPMDIMVRKRALGIPSSQEPAVPRQRTVITYLILTNFKSYAGRQEVGPFHASFSSVVGPNGSGKSNVIDSLLFVFGFRASKMRQGKLSALIHNSAAFPNLDYCEVEVHFEEVMDLPEGGHRVIPDSALVISRKAFKNNSSKYYINGKESTFTIVTTLLRDKGVDLDHKRFLILQGEVESIAQMKPKAANEHDDGLLEYLEDIIGTSKYKTPIEESAEETEKLNEVCMEKSNRVQHVEKEKNSLEDKKNLALAYIRDENELASKQSALYQLFIRDYNDHIEASQESAKQLQAELDQELEKHKGNEDEIKQLEKQYRAGLKEYEHMEKQTQSVAKELSKLDKEIVKFEEKKKFLTNKQKKLEKSLQSGKFSLSESETHAKQSADDIERDQASIEELEAEMQQEEKELARIRDNLKGKTQGLSEEIAAKQKSLEPWSTKINEKQSAIAIAQSELDMLKEKGNAAAVAISEVEAKIASYQEAKEAKSAELTDCKKQKNRVEKEVQAMQAELDELAKKEPAIRSKLSGARQKADEARASLSATQTQGNVLTGLMRLKDSGRINGFHGRLGNLGAIDAKYDVAISTACPSLDNLVVDSVEVGQQCIDYLRKNNLGRANFILLDRLPQRDLSAIQTPENVPRLFDLVKPKHDRFRPAFFSVLQNTLVAKDLEQANRIAYGAKRWRVVTLDGQLIDKSGTMSGGGTRVARGGMSSKLASDVTKDQVTKLEVDRDALERAFQEFQEQQREMEGNLRQLREQIPELETTAQKIALEIESFDRNIVDSQRRIKELGAEQQSSKSDKARMSVLEKSIASMEKEASKLREETAGVEEEIKELQDKIMEIGGVKLRMQKAKVDGLKEQIDHLTESVAASQTRKTKAEKQRTKLEKSIADAEAELEALAGEMEEENEEMQAQVQSTAGFRRQAEEAQEALETKKEELQELKKALEEKTAEINETRGAEIEMRNKLEEHQKALADYQRKLRHWEEKLSKLTYHNVSDNGEEGESMPLPTYTNDEMEDFDRDELKAAIAALEEKNANVQVDLSVLAEYRRRVEEHNSRSQDLSEAVAARDAAKKRCDDLRRLRLEGFMEGFSIISLRLKEMYQMITMGGNAELELVDSLDPFSEGILFSVMPPKKSWKNISNLSGGEKTLSSLALVFALHHYKPTPLYVMDEIDAALDFRNVSIVASYIKERTKNAQFIVISLRNNMFELASRLVGVYKVNHMTKSVSIDNKDYLVPRATAARG